MHVCVYMHLPYTSIYVYMYMYVCMYTFIKHREGQNKRKEWKTKGTYL